MYIAELIGGPQDGERIALPDSTLGLYIDVLDGVPPRFYGQAIPDAKVPTSRGKYTPEWHPWGEPIRDAHGAVLLYWHGAN